MRNVSLGVIQLIASALLPFTPLYAGETGHYVPSSWSCRDLIAAPTGTTAMATYLSYYVADKARTSSGAEVSKSTGIDLSAEAFVVMPVFVYAPKAKPLGADWSFVIAPQYGETSASGILSAYSLNTPLFDTQGTGIGDTYIVPATLTWHLSDYWALGLQYAFWAPTGEYDSDSADNVGLGYWSHDFRSTVSWFPLGNPGILASASVVHEINGDKEGYDLTPGDHTSLELGFSMAMSERLMLGMYSGGIWETGRTRGSDAADDGRDKMYNVGVEVVYWFKPGKLGAMGRVSREFEVRDRYEGTTYTLGVNYVF